MKKHSFVEYLKRMNDKGYSFRDSEKEPIDLKADLSESDIEILINIGMAKKNEDGTIRFYTIKGVD